MMLINIFIDLDRSICGKVYRPSLDNTETFCNGEKECFCKGELCLIGGTCSSGNMFVGGKPICK